MSRIHAHQRIPMKLAAAAALAAGIGVAEAPAHASIVSNALSINALSINALVPDGSTIEDLNGVAVEAVTLPDGVGAGLVAEWEAGVLAGY